MQRQRLPFPDQEGQGEYQDFPKFHCRVLLLIGCYYIAGMVAGMLSESGVIGFIGGMELDTTKGKIMAL